jgi:hypothetical protein
MMVRYCKTCGEIGPMGCMSVECDVVRTERQDAVRRQQGGRFYLARHPNAAGPEYVDPRRRG